MKVQRLISIASLSVTLLAATGCAYNDAAAYHSPVPPPPPAYDQTPPLVALADRNGFQTGEADGARDAYDRRPYRARSTRAYYETPGFDRNLGPFPPYQNAFRNAYLRGYDKGFRRG